ncbi:hypothetical protein QO002_000986 [Pararhizobium capsulatum DSM 1112]|uniref:Uncharacterized protein n=1 Tax=Pararhizobium capsulatum DSM 1112 TaxID=1121113 RepID=A0ABU0BLP9_9HYPH|nr:hypothetical protein [Pararhizobium capsulatum]MDQ0318848.1 hypothetical protein [Pararhizobium capsulatum DSM 1112]
MIAQLNPERTTETKITFHHTFLVEAQAAPLAAGSYRFTIDEEQISGLSFVAYKTVRAQLEIPSLETRSATRQMLQVTSSEIEFALLRDKKQIKRQD